MSEQVHVLDASAVLTLLLGEEGADQIEALMIGATISAVNLSEIVAKLTEYGIPDTDIDRDIAALRLRVSSCDTAQAISAGKLRRATRAAGRSSGDRACLALARKIGGIAITTDPAWLKVDCGVKIEVIDRG